MLNDTYELGTTPDNLTFTKRFGDVNKSVYSVAGITGIIAKTLTVSHQPAATGRVRTMVRIDEPQPDTTTSGTIGVPNSVYLVIDRAPTTSAADQLKKIKRFRTLVNDDAFINALLNQEV
jgi:hypothetical protein